jgi:dTDP-4-amino-4,6-dideoxygalactose transaminase
MEKICIKKRVKQMKEINEKITVTKTSMPPYEEYIEKIKPLWESHWLTNMGTYHQQLERELKDFLGVSELSLMVNGHMSLEMAIQAMNFPEGSEVITTPFTFVSTTHAIVRNRLQPVFCDIKLTDYTIDEEKIEELITPKTVAIVPVHVYGNICNVEKLQEIAYKYNLKLIYDAAHAFGETYKGQGVGGFGDASIFSFHATKVFNTIEGGAVASSSRELYERLYDLKNFGIRSEELVKEVGANAKMNEFCAAMGLCNLPYVKENISLRKERALYYNEQLKDVEGVRVPLFDNEDITYNYAYYPVVFDSHILGVNARDKIYDVLKENDIFARKYFYPLTADDACFKNKYQSVRLENAKSISDNVLVLPLYPELDFASLDRICEFIRRTLKA